MPLDVADEGIPGIPGTSGSTDNIAAEALAYLELKPGLYSMVVNSDDGFEVTAGTKDQPKYLSLGRFDGGRGATDTQFYLSVDNWGVYFFRLLWFEGGGDANVEWFTVNHDGSRALVGGEQNGSIPAFRTRTASEPVIPSAVAFDPVTVSATGEVTLTWSGSGTLQESVDFIDWRDVSPQPAGNNYAVTPDAAGMARLYRIRVQP